MPKRRKSTNKFGAKRTQVDGRTFASKAEANRYLYLKELQEKQYIQKLQCQPKFTLHAINGQKVGNYIADFRYIDRLGNHIVEDVKGVATALYKWKSKHFRAEYPEFEFYEIPAKSCY